MAKPNTLRKTVSDAVDRSADAAEEIHKAIAALPLDVLERAGELSSAVGDVRRVQERTIGAIYDLVRRINREVGRMADEVAEAAAGGERRRAVKSAPRPRKVGAPARAAAAG